MVGWRLQSCWLVEECTSELKRCEEVSFTESIKKNKQTSICIWLRRHQLKKDRVKRHQKKVRFCPLKKHSLDMLEQTFTAHIFPHKYYHQPISIIFLWFFGDFLPDRGEFCHFGVREVRVVGSGIGIFGSQLQCCILWCCLGCFRPRRLGRFTVRVFSHGKKWCWNWWVKRVKRWQIWW